MRIAVDTELCCGSGMCVLTAPDVFDQRDEDGIVVLLDPAPPAALHRDVRDAVANCPAGAIAFDEASEAAADRRHAR